MTFKEFKEIIEKSGEYQVSEEVIGGKVVYRGKDMMCSISDMRTYKMDTLYQGNEDFLEEYGEVIFEFAKTSIEDRY